LIGKCITCETEIERLGGRKYCPPCKEVRQTQKWRIANQKRPKRGYTENTCFNCKQVFYAKKANALICNKPSCRAYTYNLKQNIQETQERIEKYQLKLQKLETDYVDFKRAQL